MSRLVLIDGNSILNRAFYGIMGNKMLTTPDGKYTNAVYGLLAIMFKVMDDINPEYMAVAFDLKAPTARHKLYEGYKATRKGMPNELAEQMPIVKEILQSMHITIIEKEGYEADDILGTLAKRGEKEGFDVTILSGDRDTFQLASQKIAIRIPHTKMGKNETDTFGENEIIEKLNSVNKFSKKVIISGSIISLAICIIGIGIVAYNENVIHRISLYTIGASLIYSAITLFSQFTIGGLAIDLANNLIQECFSKIRKINDFFLYIRKFLIDNFIMKHNQTKSYHSDILLSNNYF